MKRRNRNAELIIAILLVTFSVSLAAAENIYEARLLYNKGLDAFGEQNWQLAANYFQESLKYGADSMAALMLSQVFCILDNRLAALDYANRALKYSPPLEETYKSTAYEIIAWAKPAPPPQEGTRETYTHSTPKKVTPQRQYFFRPMINGYRLDWCRVWAADCGQGAADAFCKNNGYWRAISFEIDDDIGLGDPTYVIGTGQICSEQFCDGFKVISCER